MFSSVCIPGGRLLRGFLSSDCLTTPLTSQSTFRRLLGFAAAHRRLLRLSIVLALASQAFALAIPNLTGRAIDNAIEPHDRGRLWLWAGLIVGAGLAGGALMVARRIVAGRLSLNVEFDLRQSLYTHLQRLSFGFYDRHQTGQLLRGRPATSARCGCSSATASCSSRSTARP